MSIYWSPAVSGSNLIFTDGAYIAMGATPPGDGAIRIDASDSGYDGYGVNISNGGIVIAQGTITANTIPTLSMTSTWNNAAVTFTGLKYNVTDTASDAASLLADLQVGGSSKWKVTKGGNVTSIGLTIAQGTITALATGIAQTVTWNNAAVSFIGQSFNVTDTASDASSRIAQWQLGGVDRVVFTKAGSITAAGAVQCGTSGSIKINTRSQLVSSADGLFNVTNTAGTSFTRLTLGPETNAFPSLKTTTTNGCGVAVRLGDDSGVANIETGQLILSGASFAKSGSVVLGNSTQLTVGAAGAASALPATPSGYLVFNNGGTKFVLPYYAQA
jgi:hypothetical protein